MLAWLAADQRRYERTAWLLGAVHPLDQIITLAVNGSDELGPSAPDTPASRQQLSDPLTRRQHEIAALVAEGLSNREIAQRLVISKRSVDAHLEHILVKLGASSRVQIANWMRSRLRPSS